MQGSPLFTPPGATDAPARRREAGAATQGVA
jgi:hypothetical protein